MPPQVLGIFREVALLNTVIPSEDCCESNQDTGHRSTWQCESAHLGVSPVYQWRVKTGDLGEEFKEIFEVI